MTKFFIWVLLLNVVVMPICLFLADFFFEEYLDIVLITEQVTEQVTKPIDWEQRRWDLASKIYAEMESVTLESSVRQAEIFIKYYKQTLK